MWEFGNLWADGRSNAPMASYHTTMNEIHVLLADHDSEALANTVTLLEICQYKVTFVEIASAAISLLLSGKANFDVVIANINSPDLHGFKLLHRAVNMGLPVVAMSVDDNALMALRALENGAFLYIKKPATMEVMKCMWQHVFREKTRMMREREMLMAASLGGARGAEFSEMIHHKEEDPDVFNAGGKVMMKNKCNKRMRGRNGVNDDDEGDSDNHVTPRNNVKKKMCTEWTQELHQKFMDAVEQLGEGRCFPKEILELMNVPGLTRMQVASHLQKCRNDNWRSPEERKSHQSAQSPSLEINGTQPKPRRFGSKPLLGKPQSGRVKETDQRSEHHSGNGDAQGKTGSNASTLTTKNTSHDHQQRGSSFVPAAGPRHQTDDFLNFHDVDCLVRNFSSGLQQQGCGMNNNPNSGQGRQYHCTPAYQEQNSDGPSVDSGSRWSSGTSNFESDHSESKGH